MLAVAGRSCAEKIKMIQPNRSRYTSRFPVVDTLGTHIGLISEQFGDFCRSAHVINDLCIGFQHGVILNAAFRFVKQYV